MPRPIAKWTGLLSTLLFLAACGVQDENDWKAYQSHLLLNGKLRTERAPTDAPFSTTDLAENFSKTAFGIDPEFHDAMSEQDLREVDMIRRWVKPITYAVAGRPTRNDQIALLEVMERISRASGLGVAPYDGDPAVDWNMEIYFFNHEDRGAFMDVLKERGLASHIELYSQLFSDKVICSGTMLRASDAAGNQTGEIEHALVFIRAELPDELRRSCIEEEIVQGMGLIRDDDSIRPSMFNEDEEFALMTTHDQYLMQILYDPRLSPGMTREEAMPIVRQIARQIDLSGL